MKTDKGELIDYMVDVVAHASTAEDTMFSLIFRQGQAEVQKGTGLSAERVRTATKGLMEDGWIVRHIWGGGHPTGYRIVPAACVNAARCNERHACGHANLHLPNDCCRDDLNETIPHHIKSKPACKCWPQVHVTDVRRAAQS